MTVALSCAHGQARQWALVVGCGGYDSPWAALPKGCADADAAASALDKVGYRVRIMDDNALDPNGIRQVETYYPNRVNVARQAYRWFGQGSLDPDDTLLFYFRGHSLRIDGEDYLTPLNARSADKTELIPVVWVKTWMHKTGAHHLVLIVDADRKIAGEGQPKPNDAELTPSVTLWSCAPGQISVSNDHGSLFSTALCAALTGKVATPVDAERTFGHVKAQIAAAKAAQTPLLEAQAEGLGKTVLADPDWVQ